jgi:hypothetical protein
MTREQIQAKKDKAVRFLRDVLENEDRADEVEDESVEDYAERKGLKISNPERRTITVANGNGNDVVMTKDEMQDCIDAVTQILTDAYTPEASREKLAAAVGDALAALEGDYDEEDDDGDDDDDQG